MENKEIKKIEAIDTSVSHVELKRTSKGTNISVKVYDENPTKAQQTAETIFNDLNKKYNKEE